MEYLLTTDFINHYGITASTKTNLSIQTDEPYFEIEDDNNRELQLHLVAGSGMAAFSNSPRFNTAILNYDKFMTGLANAFQTGKKRCDAIINTLNGNYFLLAELKDRNPRSNFRADAIRQLQASLALIMAVPSIAAYAVGYPIRHCCIFNKQALAPPLLTATTAFNRLNTIAPAGLQTLDPAINTLGFELWEYVGGQAYEFL